MYKHQHRNKHPCFRSLFPTFLLLTTFPLPSWSLHWRRAAVRSYLACFCSFVVRWVSWYTSYTGTLYPYSHFYIYVFQSFIKPRRNDQNALFCFSLRSILFAGQPLRVSLSFHFVFLGGLLHSLQPVLWTHFQKPRTLMASPKIVAAIDDFKM